MTTDNKQIIDGYRKEFPYPITYNKKSATKEELDVNKLGNIDMMSFGSKIGFITNCSTYWWSLLYDYEKDSIEYNEIIYRLKIMRQQQGNCIDNSKGIEVKEMPKNYYNYIKDMSDLDKQLVADKKPYFQKYVYPKLNAEYNNFHKYRDYYSLLKYNVDYQENSNEEFLKYMKFKNPTIDNKSTMNRICHYLEKEIKEVQKETRKQDVEKINSILINNTRPLLLEYKNIFDDLLIQYKQFREKERTATTKYSSDAENNKQFRFKDIKRSIRKQVYDILDNKIDVANLAVNCGYHTKSEINKDFVWEIFGKEVFENVKENSHKDVYIPVECSKEESEFMYLNNYYKKENIKNDDIQ